jgi:hypothetical protein
MQLQNLPFFLIYIYIKNDIIWTHKIQIIHIQIYLKKYDSTNYLLGILDINDKYETRNFILFFWIQVSYFIINIL